MGDHPHQAITVRGATLAASRHATAPLPRALIAGSYRCAAPQQRLELLDVAPDTHREPGQRGSTEGGRVGIRRHLDDALEHVGLELHEEAIRGRPAVGPQHAGLDREDVDDVGDLMGDRLQRRPREVRTGRPSGQAADQPTRVGVPVRRPETGQRGHEIDAARRIDLAGERLGLRGRLDDAQAVPQPLHGGAADEHRALGRELPPRPGRNRCCRLQQPLRRRACEIPDVGEDERPGSVCRLGLARCEAALTEERSLLVSGHARQRDRRAEAASPPRRPRPRARQPAGWRGRRRRARGARRPSCPVSRSRSIVRDAFVTSVTCAVPPVSFQASHESIVPKASSRCGSAVRPRIHSSFVAEK